MARPSLVLAMLILLKIALVPTLLYLLAQAGQRWGYRRAGWLSSLPWVAGPILLVLTLEQGPRFAAQAALLSLAAIAASEAFNLAYAHVCRRTNWPAALSAGLGAWLIIASPLPWLAVNLPAALAIAALACVVNLCWLPIAANASPPLTTARRSLLPRMLAGGLLTLAASLIAGRAGPHWGGIVAVFPLLGSLLAIEVQCSQGTNAVWHLMRGMTQGRPGFAAFCAVLTTSLGSLSPAVAFGAATIASVAVQQAAEQWRRRREITVALRS